MINSKKATITHKIIFRQKEYSSIAKLCEEYKINRATYYVRIRNGWTQEDALLTPITEHRIIFNQKEYSSIATLCEEYKINRATYHARIRDGWTQEDALLTPVMEYDTFGFLFKGKKYKNISELCREYNINYNTYLARMKDGWTQEEALEITQKYKNGKKIIFQNKKYSSIKMLCDNFNMDYGLYISRMNMGWTQEEALNLISRCSTTIDNKIIFQGKNYNSLKQMCDEYNVGYSKYLSRIKLGWSQMEALEVEPRKKVYKESSKKRKGNELSFRGKEYINLQEMCEYYNIGYKKYFARIKLGWTQEEALELVDSGRTWGGYKKKKQS